MIFECILKVNRVFIVGILEGKGLEVRDRDVWNRGMWMDIREWVWNVKIFVIVN